MWARHINILHLATRRSVLKIEDVGASDSSEIYCSDTILYGPVYRLFRFDDTTWSWHKETNPSVFLLGSFGVTTGKPS